MVACHFAILLAPSNIFITRICVPVAFWGVIGATPSINFELSGWRELSELNTISTSFKASLHPLYLQRHLTSLSAGYAPFLSFRKAHCTLDSSWRQSSDDIKMEADWDEVSWVLFTGIVTRQRTVNVRVGGAVDIDSLNSISSIASSFSICDL